MFVLRLFVIIAVLVSLAVSAYGWNRRGHMLAAAIAYTRLKNTDVATKNRILNSLKAHPAYKTWQMEYKRASPDSRGTDITRYYSFEAYVFMRAAVWPDELRPPPPTLEHKANWHYLNYQAEFPDKLDLDTVKPSTNIFSGYETAVKAIEKSSSAKQTRAKMISWVLHQVADIHQPLHAVTMKTSKFPNGDRGGNCQCVRPAQSKDTINLHGYWDNRLSRKKGLIEWGDALHAWRDSVFYPKLYRGIKPENFAGKPDMAGWAKESAQLAMLNVYNFRGAPIPLTSAKLTGAKCTCQGQPDLKSLPGDYDRESKKLGSQRLLVAGYRLAKTLASLKLPG